MRPLTARAAHGGFAAAGSADPAQHGAEMPATKQTRGLPNLGIGGIQTGATPANTSALGSALCRSALSAMTYGFTDR